MCTLVTFGSSLPLSLSHHSGQISTDDDWMKTNDYKNLKKQTCILHIVSLSEQSTQSQTDSHISSRRHKTAVTADLLSTVL